MAEQLYNISYTTDTQKERQLAFTHPASSKDVAKWLNNIRKEPTFTSMGFRYCLLLVKNEGSEDNVISN